MSTACTSFGMDRWQEKFITKNLPALLKSTEYTTRLSAWLVSMDVFDWGDCDYLDSKKYEGNNAQTSEMYRLLKMRTHGFESVILALLKVGQVKPHQLLLDGYTINNIEIPQDLLDKISKVNFRNRSCTQFESVARAIGDFRKINQHENQRILLVSSIETNLVAQMITETANEFEQMHVTNYPIGFQLDSFERGVTLTLIQCNFSLPSLLQKLDDWSGREIGKIIIVVGEDEDINNLDKYTSLPIKTCKVQLEWKYLTSEFQEELLQRIVMFQGRPTILSRIVGNTELAKEICGKFLVDLMKDANPVLLKDEVPPVPSFYVPRKVLESCSVSSNVLQSTDDIILVSDIEDHKLSSLTRDETDCSGNQIQELTVNCMVLEDPTHFDKICSLTSKPVHWLKYEEGDNILKWVQSRGSLTTIRSHLLSSEQQSECDEQKFLEKVNKSAQPVILTDMPGMGKSVLLSKLANQIRQEDPLRYIKFVPFSEFVKQVDIERSGSSDLKRDHIRKAFFSTIVNNIGAEFLKIIISGSENTWDLMLDGFDEVLPNHVSLAFETLRILVKDFKSARLWVTVRPHILEDIESILGSFGHHLAHFTKDDKYKFLFNFWTSKGAQDNEKLNEIAFMCVHALQQRTEDYNPNDMVSGTPLQLKIIGEVYTSEAIDFAKNSSTIPPPLFRVNSITNLYSRMVHQKIDIFLWKERSDVDEFSHARKYVAQHIKRVHMRLAIQLLFPTNLQTFEYLFLHEKDVDLKEICVHGFVELQGDRVRFVHQSFAEFFCALFLSQMLLFRNSIVDEQQLSPMANFLVKDVLATDESNQTYMPLGIYVDIKWHEFLFPVVVSFLNELVSKLEESDFHSHSSKKIAGAWLEAELSLDSISIFEASVLGNTPNICRLLVRWIQSFHEEGAQKFATGFAKNCGASMLVACKEGQISTVKLVTNCVTTVLGESVFEIELPGKLSPLHIVAERGNYSLFEFLVKQPEIRGKLLLDRQNKRGMNLLHAVVCDSHIHLDKRVLHEKKQLIKRIATLDKNKLLLRHRNSEGSTPLMQGTVHLELVKCLVEVGSDVGQLDVDGCSILHHVIEADAYHQLDAKRLHEIVKYFYDNADVSGGGGLKLNSTCSSGYSPLASALNYIDVLDETIDILTRDQPLDPTLDLVDDAIVNGRCQRVVRKIISLGADLRKGNGKGSYFHLAASLNRLDLVKMFIEEYGFDINEKGWEGNSVLHRALESLEGPESTVDLISFLIQKDVDVNALNDEGKDAVQYALENHASIGLSVLQIVGDAGWRGVNQSNLSEILVTYLFEYLLSEGKDDELVDTVRWLLHEARVGKEWLSSEHGCEVLFQAVRSRQVAALEFLVNEYELDINFAVGGGNTLLHGAYSRNFAADMYRPERKQRVIRFLIDRGADFEALNEEGKRPQDCSDGKKDGVTKRPDSMSKNTQKLMEKAMYVLN